MQATRRAHGALSSDRAEGTFSQLPYDGHRPEGGCDEQERGQDAFARARWHPRRWTGT